MYDIDMLLTTALIWSLSNFFFLQSTMQFVKIGPYSWLLTEIGLNVIVL